MTERFSLKEQYWINHRFFSEAQSCLLNSFPWFCVYENETKRKQNANYQVCLSLNIRRQLHILHLYIHKTQIPFDFLLSFSLWTRMKNWLPHTHTHTDALIRWRIYSYHLCAILSDTDRHWVCLADQFAAVVFLFCFNILFLTRFAFDLKQF